MLSGQDDEHEIQALSADYPAREAATDCNLQSWSARDSAIFPKLCRVREQQGDEESKCKATVTKNVIK